MTGPNPEFQQQLKALGAEYEAKLPARLRELDACFKRLPTDGGAGESREGLENLMALAHKLSGSAGTFGFMALGNAAEKLENDCQARLDQPGLDQSGLDQSGGFAAGGYEELAQLLAAVLGAAEKGPG